MPVIEDKDGGIIAELRPELGALPVWMPGTGDAKSRIYWTESIHITQSGDNTIHSVVSGKRFFIEAILLTVQQAGAAIRLKSGASDFISGFIRPSAGAVVSAAQKQEPMLKGVRNDDNFIINTSGDRFVPYVGGFIAGYDEVT